MRDTEAEAYASPPYGRRPVRRGPGMASPEGGGRNLPWAGAGAESRTAAAGLPKPGFPATGLCRWDGKPEASRLRPTDEDLSAGTPLMDAVVERSNLFRAYERVVQNEGAPGVDGLSVSEFKPWLERHWVRVRQDLLTGVYQPEAVRKVEIPKPQGGVRTLGIPTVLHPSDEDLSLGAPVLDRLIQQALNQVLQPQFDPGFSSSS